MTHTPERSAPAAEWARSPGATGMTLMEMMVSVAILAGMIVAFNIILTQSQRVVSGTQRMIRANAAGMAVAQVIRRDLAAVSKNGFLHVGTDGQSGQMLAFATAGTSESVTGNAEGLGSIVCYRLAVNSVDSTPSILCRRGLLLTANPGTSVDVAGGAQPDFFDVQKLSADGQIDTSVVPALRGGLTLRVPPANLTDVGNLWQVLTYNVQQLRIEYAMRNTTGGIGAWQTAARTWDSRDQDAWPAAVKIWFRVNTTSEIRRALRDVDDPANAADYEVICPVGS